ncbi:LOW QUALITY PROTEIN: hypothetical protein Cgig2_028247 [Carnegiea gigantea]|uniref:DNA-directed RNA polymerase n=1 Tax=Carnegiea gigantea TaxID=171969 RepID=A0A9Q1JJ98_9CARY|nr:LOW QUALITY PROTEIN: hypothetical protein Cgig2_028247 [Carnegiea gigantea]
MPTPQNLLTSTPLITTYESFFRLHPLSQVLGQTNPLIQIVHRIKLSCLGPGGLTKCIYSIDTSERISVGVIRSLVIHARIGPWGSLETPFYEIDETSRRVDMLYLSPSRDEYYMVASGNSLAMNQGRIGWSYLIPSRILDYCMGTALELGVLAIAKHKGNVIYIDTVKIILSGNGDTLSILLVMYQRSNKNTCMH